MTGIRYRGLLYRDSTVVEAVRLTYERAIFFSRRRGSYLVFGSRGHAARRHEFGRHTDGREQIDVAVVERELDEDGARVRVHPIGLVQILHNLFGVGLRQAQIHGVAAAFVRADRGHVRLVLQLQRRLVHPGRLRLLQRARVGVGRFRPTFQIRFRVVVQPVVGVATVSHHSSERGHNLTRIWNEH